MTPTPADHSPQDERDALGAVGSFVPDAPAPPDRRHESRRREDAWRRDIEGAVRDLADRLPGRDEPPPDPPFRGPFWKRWTVSEYAAAVGILAAVGGFSTWAVHTIKEAVRGPVTSLQMDFNDFRRGTEQWREGFANEIRDVRFDVCVAGKLASESECVRTVYRSTPGQQRVDSVRRALPENP